MMLVALKEYFKSLSLGVKNVLACGLEETDDVFDDLKVDHLEADRSSKS